jgi:steroid delta-isomerase-like uncharacterized protein
MSVAPDALIRTWFEEVWNEGREDTIDRLIAPGAPIHGLPGGDLHGAQGFKGNFATFRGAFPDIKIQVERTVMQGDLVAAHCRVTGTHTGPALGLPPTGKPVEFGGMVIVRVSNGQFQEGWNSFDFLTMYQQIGAVPQF